jgi:hypothetical protein
LEGRHYTSLDFQKALHSLLDKYEYVSFKIMLYQDHAAPKITVRLEKVDNKTGRLNILWADKKYSADFTAHSKKADSPS